MTGKPTVRLRRLGERLHQIREDQRLTLAEAGDLLGRSRSSLGKIEKGQVHVPARDVDYMLTKYGITDEAQRGELLALARDGRKEGWWTRHQKTLPPSALDYISLEAGALSMYSFEITLVPGLLQTEEYTRAIFTEAFSGQNEIDRQVSIRMARQRELFRPESLKLQAVVGEAALHQMIGGTDVMRCQLRHMANLSTRSSISLRVLPYQVGAHLGLDGAFTILELADFSVVSIGALVNASFIESDSDINRYREVFRLLSDRALSAPDSQKMIERTASDF